MGICGEAPAALHDLARGALGPEGAGPFLGAEQELAATEPAIAKERLIFWAYRTVGPHLPSAALAAIWLQRHLNAMLRFREVLGTLGPACEEQDPLVVGAEPFQ